MKLLHVTQSIVSPALNAATIICMYISHSATLSPTPWALCQHLGFMAGRMALTMSFSVTNDCLRDDVSPDDRKSLLRRYIELVERLGERPP